MDEELEMVSLRLRKGDKDALALYFHPRGYNEVIRKLVSKAVDTIRARGAAAAEQLEAVEVELPE